MRLLYSITTLSIFTIFLNLKTVNAQTGNVGIGTTTPGSKLTVNGSFATSYRAEAGTTGTIGANDYYVAWNGPANGTLTLPAAISGAGNFKGRLYFVKNTSTAFNLTLAANGSEQIDGATSISIPPGYAVNLVNTGATSGATWQVVLFSSASIPQFRTSSVISSSGSITLTGIDATPRLMPGMTLNVNNPTGQSLNYLINVTVAMDGGLAAPTDPSVNMFTHILPRIYVDGVASNFVTFIEAEPARVGNEASSNLIGAFNGIATLGPGNHTLEIRYVCSGFSNMTTCAFNQAGSTISASTIY